MTAQEKKVIKNVVEDEKTAQKIISALEKAQKKSKTKKSSSDGAPRDTKDGLTLVYLRSETGATLKEIVARLFSKFPTPEKYFRLANGDRKKASEIYRKVLAETTHRRLHGYLQSKFGLKIAQHDNGRYYIVQKKSASAKTEKPTPADSQTEKSAEPVTSAA